MFGLDRTYFPLWLEFSEDATLIPDHIKMFSYLFHLGFASMVRGLTRGVSGSDFSTSPFKKLLCLSRRPSSSDNIFSILIPDPHCPPFSSLPNCQVGGKEDEVYCVFFTGKRCSGGVVACYLSFYSSEYFDANNFPYQYYTLI
jgi:hypothetical protein